MEQLNTNAPFETAATILNSFDKAYKQGRMEKALKGVQAGDPQAMTELYATNPELAMRIQDQRRQQEEAQRVATSRTASGDYVKKTNPNDANIAAAIDAGADPKDLLMIGGRQSRITSTQLKAAGSAHDKSMAILAAVQPGDDAGFADAKTRVKQIYGDAGLDTSYIDNLPSSLTPELKRQLQDEGQSTAQQLGAVAKENGLGETVRHHEVIEGQGDRRIDVSERQGDARIGISQQNANTSQSRATEGVRHNQASEGNTRRGQDVQSETTRRGQDLRGRGHGGGANRPTIIVNPKTGQRMKLEGGKWVPIQ